MKSKAESITKLLENWLFLSESLEAEKKKQNKNMIQLGVYIKSVAAHDEAIDAALNWIADHAPPIETEYGEQ